MNQLLCPICNASVSGGSLKSWKFLSYEVKRYECPKCESKFNVYHGPKGTYTIPKSK